MRYVPILAVAVCLLFAGGAGCSSKARRDRYLGRANRYFAAEQYDKAEIEYLNALRLDATNGMAIRRLGEIYFAQGKVPSAFPFLYKAVELEPDNSELRRKLCVTFLSGGRLKEAREEALRILEREPGNDEAFFLLADASVSAKDIYDTLRRIEEVRSRSGETAGFHLALGALHVRQKDFDKAEAAFKRAAGINPKSATVQLALGRFYWARNDLKQAEAAFTAAAELSPPRSPAATSLAELKASTGDLETAKRLLTRVTERAPDYIPALYRLAEISFAEKKYDECGALIQKVLTRHAANYEALMLGARLYLAKGEAAKAVAEFEKIKRIYSKVPQVHYQLGLAQLVNHDTAKAIVSLNEAVTLDPDFADAVLALAQLNINKGDYSPVVSSLTRLIKQKPQIAQAHLLLANAQAGQGHLDDAVRTYQRLMELFPTDPQTPLLMGLAFLQQDKKAEARKAFEKSLELAPEYLPAVEQLVNLDIDLKQYSAALQRVEARVEQKPDTPVLQFLMAKIFIAQKTLDKAEAALLKAIQLAPDYRPPYLLLARIYVEGGKHNQAVDQLKAVLEKNPKDVAALTQLAMIYSEIKNLNAARETYERILEINPKSGLAMNNLAYLYSEHFGQLDKAYDLAKRTRDLFPNDPFSADTLGWVLYKRSDYQHSLTLLQESSQKLPNEPEILLHLGMAYYMTGEETLARNSLEKALKSTRDLAGRREAAERLELLNRDTTSSDPKAVADLETWLSDHPDDPIALARAASLYQRNGAPEKAVKTYERVVKQNPKNSSALLNLARLYSEQLHDPSKALEFAKKARDLAPDDPNVAHILGQLTYQNGDHQRAAGLLAESARKLPNDPQVLYDLAWACLSVGRIAEAQTAMQGVVRTSRDAAQTTEAKRFLAMISLHDNPQSAGQAASQVQDILKKEPDYLPALDVGAFIDELRGDNAEAIKAYEVILARYPAFTPSHKHLAKLYLEVPGSGEKAFAQATKAREAFPNDPDVAKTLGIAVYRRGDYRRAAELLKESAQSLKSDAEVFFYLGMSHFQLKDNQASKQALQKALASNAPPELQQQAKKALADIESATSGNNKALK